LASRTCRIGALADWLCFHSIQRHGERLSAPNALRYPPSRRAGPGAVGRTPDRL